MAQRIALITGAANGIGKAISLKFLSENYLVLGIDNNERAGKEMVKEIAGGQFDFKKINIGSEKEVRKLFTYILGKYKRLDVVVNNAGIVRDNLIWNMPSEDFDQVLNVNLKGTWLICKEAASLMKEQKSGRIINIASRAWLGNRGQSNYAASKAGVVSLTRVLALELGKYNVYVNSIAPGLIDTPLTQKLTDEVRQQLILAQPTKLMGKPDDIAHAAAFLANEQTHFITGQTIYVDGGKSIGAGI